ncbi:MAG TPA: hypothetical protein VD902_21880, partial [Symbiobacteriaceae bacterium]|nr:hypothetical protein [Symbiobacteriaceae bacterium]
NGFALEQDLSVSGGLELTDVTVSDQGELSARVVNRLAVPVNDLMVGYGSNWAMVGTLQPGATSDPFALALSQSLRNGGPMGWEAVRMRRNMQTQEDWMAEENRYQIMNAVFGYNGMNMTPGTVVASGWLDEPLATPNVPALGRAHQGGNLVWAVTPLPFDPASGNVPPGIAVAVRTGGSDAGRSPYGYSLSQGSHTFSLVVPAVNPANVAEVRLHLEALGKAGDYAVQIRNQKSGEWVKAANDSTQVLANWQELAGPGGLMELKIEVEQHLELAPPTISMKGVSR